MSGVCKTLNGYENNVRGDSSVWS